jgi:hypothetical protein
MRTDPSGESDHIEAYVRANGKHARGAPANQEALGDPKFGSICAL